MKIAIDFDGTCVKHRFPKVGESIGAEPVLRELVKRGHKLILWTVRDGKELQDAVIWFGMNGILLYGINDDPFPSFVSGSKKVCADMFIDDLALGVPLVCDGGDRYVDWLKVRELLGL